LINTNNTKKKYLAIKENKKTKLSPKIIPQWSRHSVAPDIAAALKNYSFIMEKEHISGIWFF